MTLMKWDNFFYLLEDTAVVGSPVEVQDNILVEGSSVLAVGLLDSQILVVDIQQNRFS